MKLPNDFNWEDYIFLNPDLKRLRRKSAEKHYLNFGHKEKREYNIIKKFNPDFNFDLFKKMRLDVCFEKTDKEILKMLKDNIKKTNQPINKRLYTTREKLPNDFNWKNYLRLNPMLLFDKYIQNKEDAEKHYISYGLKEDRIYKLEDYKNENIDLVTKDNLKDKCKDIFNKKTFVFLGGGNSVNNVNKKKDKNKFYIGINRIYRVLNEDLIDCWFTCHFFTDYIHKIPNSFFKNLKYIFMSYNPMLDTIHTYGRFTTLPFIDYISCLRLLDMKEFKGKLILIDFENKNKEKKFLRLSSPFNLSTGYISINIFSKIFNIKEVELFGIGDRYYNEKYHSKRGFCKMQCTLLIEELKKLSKERNFKLIKNN